MRNLLKTHSGPYDGIEYLAGAYFFLRDNYVCISLQEVASVSDAQVQLSMLRQELWEEKFGVVVGEPFSTQCRLNLEVQS